MQTSLAALQGLESKSKKLHVDFKGAWAELLHSKMALYLTDEPAVLTSMCRELVTTCLHHVFPDLESCEVISGCDYHPDEVKLVQNVISDTEATIHKAVAVRKEKIAALEGLESGILALLVRPTFLLDLCMPKTICRARLRHDINPVYKTFR